MKMIPGFARYALLGLAVALFAAGCHKAADQTAADANQAGNQASPQDSSADPASANIAPISNATTAAAPAPASEQQSAAAPAATSTAQQSAPPPAETSTAQQSAPPLETSSAPDQAVGADVEEADYGVQPAYTAPQPPPELPEYEQPQAPGDGYLWTPGYWSWGSGGYYWVPGGWVQAPYEGALWTPGYWGYRHNRYEFFRGYWGPHIGYYGGVNYGFGYIGFGYQGGYWRGGRFNYNRTVNNINVEVVHNVYSYTVVNRNTTRVSFNGGRGGIQIRPRAAEVAAWREPHAAPMRTQLENEHAASANRAQFVAVNHGRPASLVVSHPLEADRGVRPMAPPPMRVQAHTEPAGHEQRPMEQQRQMEQHHPMEQQHPMQQQRPAEQHHPMEQQHPMQQQRQMQQQRPAEQQHTAPHAQPHAEHPAAAPRAESHAQPKPHVDEQHHPAARPEEHRN